MLRKSAPGRPSASVAATPPRRHRNTRLSSGMLLGPRPLASAAPSSPSTSDFLCRTTSAPSGRAEHRHSPPKPPTHSL